MELFLLFLIGGGGYWLFRNNTNRGKEVVRAYVFLDGLAQGETLDEVNRVVSQDMMNGPIEVTLAARDQLHRRFGGKVSAMIGLAYAKGMLPKVGAFERAIMGVDATPIPDEPPAPAPEWVKPFLLYYVLTQLQSETIGPELAGPLRGQISKDTHMLIAVLLEKYMQFRWTEVVEFDAAQVLLPMQKYLRQQFALMNSEGSVRDFVQAERYITTGIKLTGQELDLNVAAFRATIAQSDEIAQVWRYTMLLDQTEEQFEAVHGQPFGDFNLSMVEFHKKLNRQESQSAL